MAFVEEWWIRPKNLGFSSLVRIEMCSTMFYIMELWITLQPYKQSLPYDGQKEQIGCQVPMFQAPGLVVAHLKEVQVPENR